MAGEFSFRPLGDTGVRVEVAREANADVLRVLLSLEGALERYPIVGVTEWVHGYTTLTVYYRPEVVRYGALCEKLKEVLARAREVELPPARVVEVPVRYGGTWGPDLGFVAEHAGKSEAEVIALHSGRNYLVYLLGFAPGFPYLLGLARELTAPRLATPRTQVPAGSVGIGGEQTGIYPLATPGGWRIIGQTAVRLYDPQRAEPFLLRAGDYVRFMAVGEGEHQELLMAVRAGGYAGPTVSTAETAESAETRREKGRSQL